jgi:hypothetical protein
MTQRLQSSSETGACELACALPALGFPLLLLLPTDAVASFNGKIEIGFSLMFIGGLIVSIPGGLACLAAEWAGATRRPPRWAAIVALLLGVIALGGAMFVPPDRSAAAFSMFVLPPLMALALITLLPAPAFRLATVWLVSCSSIVLIITVRSMPGAPDNVNALAGGLLGGALTHILLWQIGFMLGQRRRRIAGLPPPPAPDIHGLLRRGFHAVDTHGPEAIGLLRVHPGIWWWAGGSVVFFVAILALATTVDATLLQSAIRVSYRLRALFGLPRVNGPTQTFFQLWFTDGVLWSVMVGAAVWGAAAVFRRFDAGCLAPLRLVAIVLPVVMLIWLAHESSEIKRINDAELRATGRLAQRDRYSHPNQGMSD